MQIHLGRNRYMPDLGIIILAAGGSSRMGQPKQLLEIEGQSLIRKTVLTALATEGKPIVLVLGNAFEEIRQEIADLDIRIVQNRDWEKGMAGSLRIGATEIMETAPHLKAVLILLCDQPLLDAEYLQKLYQEFKRKGKQAIASKYGEVKGVPAIFDFELLERFNNDAGDFGARHLIQELAKKEELAVLDFPGGAIDLDTPKDYADFLKREN
jgi:molybdenum cofactor cytidylyltransferase